jgi:serine/threonine protein kinase
VRFGAAAVDLGKLDSEALERAAPGWKELPEETLRAQLITQGALTAEAEADILAALESNDDSSAHTLRSGAALTALGTAPGWLAGAEPLPGSPEMAGRYQRIREYGRGGMGRVMLVHDSVLARDIALKELAIGQTGDSMLDGVQESQASAPMVARFLQEARITGQLEHPGIVPVYELGHRSDGTVYYTMKLVRGRTLSECIRAATTLQERLALLPHFVNLCQAIAYAHSRGVLHRDIKPGNVMLGEFGETVVLDWGLAKPKEWDEVALGDAPKLSGGGENSGKLRLGAESSSGKTAYGEALGTPAYMAPEQASGDLDRIDERSDVYSLGMVLFELLAGRLPFEGEGIQQLLARAITGDMPHIHKFEPKVPMDLAAICRRALSKEPARRYQSAKNLADEVQRFLSGALVEAYTYSWRERMRRFVRTYWLTIGILAASAAAVAFIGAGAVYRVIEERNRAVQQEQAAVAAKQAAEVSRNDAEAARAVAETSEQRAEDAERAARRGLFQSNLGRLRGGTARAGVGPTRAPSLGLGVPGGRSLSGMAVYPALAR